jgi:voltage-gated potassium channel
MVVLCVTVHALGLSGIMNGLRSERARPLREGRYHVRGFGVVLTVFGLLGLHALQIAAYAILYNWLGEFHDFETALYFSGTTFTTLGYGDVQIGPTHRLLAAGEGLIGLILIGWSTAILVAVTTRLLGNERRE